MKIYITNNTAARVGRKIKRVIKSAIKATVTEFASGKSFEVSVMLVNNEEIHELNLSHRNMDKPTDVLSFPLIEDFDGEERVCPNGHEGPVMSTSELQAEFPCANGGESEVRLRNVPVDYKADPNDGLHNIMLGDIVISMEQAEIQAENYGHSLEREVGFLTVHSMLHLFGYDHETPEDEMEMFVLQEKILNQMGLSRMGIAGSADSNDRHHSE